MYHRFRELRFQNSKHRFLELQSHLAKAQEETNCRSLKNENRNLLIPKWNCLAMQLVLTRNPRESKIAYFTLEFSIHNRNENITRS